MARTYKEEGKWKWTDTTVKEMTARLENMRKHADELEKHIAHVREVVEARKANSGATKLEQQIAKAEEKLRALKAQAETQAQETEAASAA